MNTLRDQVRRLTRRMNQQQKEWASAIWYATYIPLTSQMSTDEAFAQADAARDSYIINLMEVQP